MPDGKRVLKWILKWYNAATCARKIKDNEKALKYYTIVKELNYKPDYCTYYIAKSLNSLDKQDEMEKVLVEGLEKYKTSKAAGPMKKMLVTFYLQEGVNPYNEANTILKSYSNLKEDQRSQELYNATVVKANVKFKEAKPYFEKVISIDPNNENAKKKLTEINDSLSEKKS